MSIVYSDYLSQLMHMFTFIIGFLDNGVSVDFLLQLWNITPQPEQIEVANSSTITFWNMSNSYLSFMEELK